MRRIVQPEILDELPAGDPRAIRSRRDLLRINWWLRNTRWISEALSSSLPQPPKTLLELGSGDGKQLLEVTRALARRWKTAGRIILLDQQPSIAPDTLKGFEDLGWSVETLVLDLRDWVKRPTPARCDVVMANLFLHHFEDKDLREVFRSIAETAGLFVACEPRRWAPALAATSLLRLIGCNEVTRHDARVSVQAGFDGRELTALWPEIRGWTIRETPAGLGSHLFVAIRDSVL